MASKQLTRYASSLLKRRLSSSAATTTRRKRSTSRACSRIALSYRNLKAPKRWSQQSAAYFQTKEKRAANFTTTSVSPGRQRWIGNASARVRTLSQGEATSQGETYSIEEHDQACARCRDGSVFRSRVRDGLAETHRINAMPARVAEAMARCRRVTSNHRENSTARALILL